MLNTLTGTGEKRLLSQGPKKVRDLLSIITALYTMLAAFIYPEPYLHRSLSFGLIFAILFLSYTSPGSDSKTSLPKKDILFALMSLSVSAYIGLNLERLISRYIFFDPVSLSDVVFFGIAMFLMLEGSRRIIGPWLPGLTLFSLLYLTLGQFIPGQFSHQGFSLAYMTDGLFLSTFGLWGPTMGTATGHVMIFLIFGAFFIRSGAGDFLFDFATAFAGASRGGISKIAVITSALFGMISGGPISNISTTGSITIPAMVKNGYPPEFAASTECCASVGGIFMPPIMGSVIFIMSEITGIPYSQIGKQAFLPALIYFSALFFIIDARSAKLGISGYPENKRESFQKLMTRGIHFFVPLFYLIIRLISGISPSRAGLETIAVIMIITAFGEHSFFHLNTLGETLVAGIKRSIMVVSTLATCSILVGVITITGISTKFSSYLMSMVDFSITLTLVLVMLITLFLGLAMNMTSSYLITAVICAPILIRYGFEPLSVHMFILYFATTATITPPVAVTAFLAASMAGASPMRVGFSAMKMGMVAYILPFVFITNPAILLIGTPLQILLGFGGALLGVSFIAYGSERWWAKSPIPWTYALPLILAGIMPLTGNLYFILGGLTLAIGLHILLTWQRKKIATILEENK